MTSQQITRLSPHQNGKVFGVLMALTSLIFIVPFALLFGAFGRGAGGPSWFMVILMPLVYLIFGYLSVLIGCVIYNVMVRHIGGIEFETRGAAE